MFIVFDKKIYLKLFCILFVSLNSFSSWFEELSDISNGNESPKTLSPHNSPKKKSPEKRGVFPRNRDQDKDCKKRIDFSVKEESFSVSSCSNGDTYSASNSPNVSPTKKYLEKSCSSSSSSSSSSNAQLTIKSRKKVLDFDSDDECFDASSYNAERCVVNLLSSSSAVSAATDVYISMTTSPTRLPNLEHILAQLSGLLTSGEIKAVYVNLPKNYRNQVANENGQISTYDETVLSRLKEKFGEKIIVNVLKHDLGPISKILPTIKILKNDGQHQALVISIDDDQYYHPQSIQELIKYKKDLTDHIFSFAGGPLDHYHLYDEKELRFPGICVGSVSDQSLIAPEESWQEIVKAKESQIKKLKANYDQINSKMAKENKTDGQEPSPNTSPKAERIATELKKENSNLSSLKHARNLTCQKNLFKFCKKGALTNKEQKEVNKKALGMDVDIVEGQACIIYAVNDLDANDIFLLEHLSNKELFGKDCHLSDDLIISFVLSLNGKNCIYLKKNDQLNPWHIACQQSHALITDGALTHGSGYSEQEVQAMGIKHDKNNDKIKYQRALNILCENLKENGRFLSKNDMVETIKKSKRQ